MLAGCRAPPEFLLSIVADRRAEFAIWALSALASSRFRDDVAERARIAAQAHPDAHVMRTYLEQFESDGHDRRRRS